LVNLYGEVIGINTMIRGLHSGIGFAIPSNLAKRVTERLIEDGKFTRSWIGVRISTLREQTRFRSLIPDVEDGVIIENIVANGPASKSALKAGDVVVAVDGRTVMNSRQLKEEISMKNPGQTVTLDVVRGKQRTKVKVKTEALPEEPQLVSRSAPSRQDSDTAEHGIVAQTLTKQMVTEHELDVAAGVLVEEVRPETPASRAGIREGDVITDVNWQSVVNIRQFRAAMKNGNLEKGIVVNVVSNGMSRFVILRDSED
jgi:S1-C subfamily serine protease